MNLYTFKNFSEPFPQLQGAPRIVPVGPVAGPGANYLASDSPGYQLVDIINEFQWTTTPKSGRQEVPAIFLKEKRLKTNAMIAQGIYYSLALGNVTAGALAGLSNLPPAVQNALLGAVAGVGAFKAGQFLGTGVQNIAGSLAALFTRNPGAAAALQSVGGAANGAISTAAGIAGFTFGYNVEPNSLTSGLNYLVNNLGSLGKNLPQQFNIDSLGSSVLSPYEGLYITEDTKFLYNFPYFSNEQNTIQNMFGDQDEVFTNIDPLNLNALAGGMRGLASYISGIANFDAPGIYIEKPKFFNFAHEGETIRFSFPLINTGWSNFTDVSRNWQLLFLLTYQNRPNRRSRDLIDPAVIYEITIPGVRYYPFAYISELRISFAGARRRMNVPVPVGGGTTTINTIIPDAYVVDITLRTLVTETQNFLYSALRDRQNLITVTDNNDFLTIAAREMARSYNQVNLTTQLNSSDSTKQSGAQFIGNQLGRIFQ